jgi:hypothetical protein
MVSNSQKNVKIVKNNHQKKPSIGTTLSKGQKQLRQILNNQQQNLSQSPSKHSFERVTHQALNSFNHNSLINSQVQFNKLQNDQSKPIIDMPRSNVISSQ